MDLTRPVSVRMVILRDLVIPITMQLQEEYPAMFTSRQLEVRAAKIGLISTSCHQLITSSAGARTFESTYRSMAQDRSGIWTLASGGRGLTIGGLGRSSQVTAWSSLSPTYMTRVT